MLVEGVEYGGEKYLISDDEDYLVGWNPFVEQRLDLFRYHIYLSSSGNTRDNVYGFFSVSKSIREWSLEALLKVSMLHVSSQVGPCFLPLVLHVIGV